MPTLPTILALVGPTASGKTPVSLHLAKILEGEIVSADSRQVYRYMDIGTAKPLQDDLKLVEHHFVDILDPDVDYSAGEFAGDARNRVLEILKRGKIPIVVGGSGLYVRALIDGLFEGPGKDAEIRHGLEDQLKDRGSEALFDVLKKVDPESARNMDTKKPRRIIRALEVYYITGKPISQLHKEGKNPAPFNTLQFGIRWSREALYQKINERVDAMIHKGLLDEVRNLRKLGYDMRYNALNTVGYKEVFDHFEGKLDLGRMIELVKQNTRRFAKRQLTWFKADGRIRWVDARREISSPEFAQTIAREFSRKIQN